MLFRASIKTVVLVLFTTRMLTAVRPVITSGIITSVPVIAMVAVIALSHPGRVIVDQKHDRYRRRY